MKRYITVDGGTTNTRVYLVCDGNVADSVKIPMGSKNRDSRAHLADALRTSISNLLSSNGLKSCDVSAVIASGMITSEFGLYTVAHTQAPAGIRELHDSAIKVCLPEISDIPFFFIGGVKALGESLAECDIMRGEETELFGIINGQSESLFVLPGSHSKIVRIGADGRIIGFKTMLTGEMMAAISTNTILSGCVDMTQSSFDYGALTEGYLYAVERGLNEALFKVRVLKNILGKDEEYTYSFFVGAVLKDEIKAILSHEEKSVVIGGRAQIRRATAHILRAVSDRQIQELDDGTVDTSVVRGAIKIYEFCAKCK